MRESLRGPQGGPPDAAPPVASRISPRVRWVFAVGLALVAVGAVSDAVAEPTFGRLARAAGTLAMAVVGGLFATGRANSPQLERVWAAGLSLWAIGSVIAAWDERRWELGVVAVGAVLIAGVVVWRASRARGG